MEGSLQVDNICGRESPGMRLALWSIMYTYFCLVHAVVITKHVLWECGSLCAEHSFVHLELVNLVPTLARGQRGQSSLVPRLPCTRAWERG